MAFRFKQNSVLPGFGMSMGVPLTYLSLIVLIPLSCLAFKTAGLTWPEFVETATNPRILASYRFSFFTSAVAAGINAVFGLLVAWVLVRYNFPGKRIVDALVDLPFALPTAVAGISLTAIYSKNGWIGRFLEDAGIKIAFTQWGIIVALTFIGLPFVVRTLQPVLQDFDPELEEAAASLGAGRLKPFTAVIFPNILPALLTGFAMAFARSLGEYGSVVFISGNLPMKTE